MAIDPSAPHDSLVKELLGSPGDAAAVLDTVLPSGVRAAIDWTSLEREDGEIAAKRDASTHTDLLFRARARVWAESLVARGAIAQGAMLLCLAAVGEAGDPVVRVEGIFRHAAPWLEMLLTHDSEQVETLLVYLAVTTRLTGAELAAMLSAHGAFKVSSTLNGLREMWKELEREEGRAEGKRSALVATVRRLLTLKFGALTDEQVRSIEQADEARLEVFLERVLTADSIEAVLAAE